MNRWNTKGSGYGQDHLPNGGLDPSGETVIFIDFSKNEKKMAKCKQMKTLPLLETNVFSCVCEAEVHGI